jgi:hypothetical protein
MLAIASSNHKSFNCKPGAYLLAIASSVHKEAE